MSMLDASRAHPLPCIVSFPRTVCIIRAISMGLPYITMSSNLVKKLRTCYVKQLHRFLGSYCNIGGFFTKNSISLYLRRNISIDMSYTSDLNSLDTLVSVTYIHTCMYVYLKFIFKLFIFILYSYYCYYLFTILLSIIFI